MDAARAKRMAQELTGETIGEWLLTEYIDCGKSALVFKGERNGKIGAIKIFDPELIQRFGRDVQLERINRELLLKDKNHDNLIHIIDGGECSRTGYLFVVMEYINAPSLDKIIDKIPQENISNIISQVAEAAKYLESIGLCHRDIKPSNIVITDNFEKAILLDLGVLRPIGNSSLTDEGARQFIGTLRYSSPEFLMREEADTIEGWRAITFYQIGAVLHDLIMKKPIFSECSDPFARLVDAVKNVKPVIKASDIDSNIIQLTKSCLIKDPKTRLEIVNWDSFKFDEKPFALESIINRVKQRHCAGRLAAAPRALDDEANLRKQIRERRVIQDNIESIIRCICNRNEFPPVNISINNKPASLLFQLAFSPSSKYQLNVLLYITINVEFIGADSDVIDISYQCSICGLGVNFEMQDKFHPIYKGSYQEEIVKEKFIFLIYSALDSGQMNEDNCISKQIELGPF